MRLNLYTRVKTIHSSIVSAQCHPLLFSRTRSTITLRVVAARGRDQRARTSIGWLTESRKVAGRFVVSSLETLPRNDLERPTQAQSLHTQAGVTWAADVAGRCSVSFTTIDFISETSTFRLGETFESIDDARLLFVPTNFHPTYWSIWPPVHAPSRDHRPTMTRADNRWRLAATRKSSAYRERRALTTTPPPAAAPRPPSRFVSPRLFAVSARTGHATRGDVRVAASSRVPANVTRHRGDCRGPRITRGLARSRGGKPNQGATNAREKLPRGTCAHSVTLRDVVTIVFHAIVQVAPYRAR